VYGANEASGFVGNFIDFRTNGASQFTVNYNGGITNNGGTICVTTSTLYCLFAASSQVGIGNNSGQHIRVGNGTLNVQAVNSSTIPEIYVAASGSSTNQDATGHIHAAGLIPGVLYSAAGTPLPSCAVGIKGEQAVVSDATLPTYMGAYTSGGAITAAVICSYNGTTYAWLMH
jgi:hypothetical protein